jgi:hypothetical protein
MMLTVCPETFPLNILDTLIVKETSVDLSARLLMEPITIASAPSRQDSQGLPREVR